MTEGYGSFIKKHRIASGYKSQRKLSYKSGVSAATISRIESEIQLPEVRTLQTLSLYLKTTTISDLFSKCGYASLASEEKLTIDLSDSDLLDKYEVIVNQEKLTKEELFGIIAFVKTTRKIR